MGRTFPHLERQNTNPFTDSHPLQKCQIPSLEPLRCRQKGSIFSTVLSLLGRVEKYHYGCEALVGYTRIRDKRLCIDLSCWIVQLQNANKSHCGVKDKLYLMGLFHRLRALIPLNCTLIFVADGSIPAMKLPAYTRRPNGGTEVAKGNTNSQKMSSLRRNMGSDFSRMIKEAKVLGMALGIPCLDGKEEAEAQGALLNLESLCVSA